MTTVKKKTEEAEKVVAQYDKIEGWLVIVDLGLLFALLRRFVLVLRDLFPGFARETLGSIMTPGTNAYNRLMAPVSTVDLIVDTIFFVFVIVVVVYFNQRKRIAPKLMIVYLLVMLAYNTFFFALGRMIPALTGTRSAFNLAQSAVVTAIWITYFKVSKRVQGTFVR